MSPRRRAAKTIHAILFAVVDHPSASEIASVIAGSGAHEKARRVRAGGGSFGNGRLLTLIKV
jgi:hypothetical protein